MSNFEIGMLVIGMGAVFMFVRKLLSGIEEINRYHRGEQLLSESKKLQDELIKLDSNLKSAKIKYKEKKDELLKGSSNNSTDGK